MKLEKGKVYRTKSGECVRIICDDFKDPRFPCIGLTLSKGFEYILFYYSNGISLFEDSNIVSEWVEELDFDWNCLPAWYDFVAMDADGEWFSFAEEPKRCNIFWDSTAPVRIPLTHVPKNYTGDWKDSLRERPKK